MQRGEAQEPGRRGVREAAQVSTALSARAPTPGDRAGHGAMTVDEHEDLFALLDHALEELGVRTQQRSVEVRVTKPDGTVHVCCGAGCSEVELNSDKHYVCKWSGIVSSALRVREDYSTGRQAGSANPDDHAGEPLGGTWKPK